MRSAKPQPIDRPRGEAAKARKPPRRAADEPRRLSHRAPIPLRLLRNTLLLLVPLWALWAAASPLYNGLLLAAGERTLNLVESPDVTELMLRQGGHHAYVARRDFPPARTLVQSFRVTDLHFHLVLLLTLFLAVPGVPWSERLRNLGWAALITVAFDLLLLVVFVQSVYATRLGAWSLQHYGPLARNLWGMAEHLLDLPVKLALPFALWAGFYLRLLAPAEARGR